MTRPLSIPLTPGLPDAGAPGQWLGRDALGAVYVLRWLPEKQCWGALGFRGDSPRPWPELVLLRDEQAGHILGHVEGPPIAPAPIPSRLSRFRPEPGFVAAAIADVARDDTADAAPLWQGLLWPFLPALGAAAILAAVSAWSLS